MLLGGALTSALSWSWIFYINVPVGALVIAVSPWLLRESRADLKHRHFDFAGAASITGGLMLLVYAMTRATQHGWGTAETIGLLAASAALVAAFFTIELRSKAPLLPLRIFRLRTLSGSNLSGLLMGAVTNLRPDLFKVVVSHVPFVDVMNTMLDASLPLTVGEYEEWGNPNDKAAYDYMLQYSPYDNIAKKDYPSVLVKTSFNDSQVMYWEPAKYIAKLRTVKTDSNPLLLKINMGAGHGGASGRYDYLREIALDYAFLLTHLAIPT